MRTIADWLTEIGLPQYADLFVRDEIGFDVLADLSEADLAQLGIPLGSRKRLLKAIGTASRDRILPEWSEASLCLLRHWDSARLRPAFTSHGGISMDLSVLQDIPPWEWPEDTGKTLLGILLDDQAAECDRVLAAELAGDYTVINDELAHALLENLADGNRPEEVRGRAAISLGPVLEQGYIEEFEDPEAVPITEPTFRRIQESLHQLYADAGVPKHARRRILEASVRAPQDWHGEAVRAAYASEDEDWKLTGVFCMRFIRGFDEQILEALDSKNQSIHYEAVIAAGNWELDEAWPHVAALLDSKRTEKPLLLAAIEAAASIRPGEAAHTLIALTNSRDEDIVEAAYEAMAMAQRPWAEDEEYEDDDDDYDDDDDDEDERTR